ncbi:MAG: peptide chain release factor N(5)-glutamine methyltransferase [Melioribacteraceae bacterium]|nr:peptide chain release factor N(5)-glutamine methyltransferase [Melioribacteraceae bacterium]MCF8354417.1 peptide chain release factor N(5)-glutamine methyltransferase [Melioribacteraceae bacterium]MCF8392986.1 peptide chain release factor N(5)-glutamine methyltransferase [Melioribacteraceae bacterium]MCF8417271.1 peptide chain release factor N(5)-glutamine methyltransferase [Melioribacteraceae bacterium]
MLTVLEAITLSTDYLEKKGVESARMNAELLLAEILHCKRLELYLAFDRPVTEDEKIKYREFISRRGKFEPLQYIIGNVEFYGYPFEVNPSVLIPRPETEILVEKIIENHNNNSRLRILDIGTGSGNIPVVLAKELSEPVIISVDISENALKLAAQNASKNNVTHSIVFIQSDILKNDLKDYGNFDIIVSNPPYVNISDYKNLQKEILIHEPMEALTDSKDGFTYYNRIIELSDSLLKNGGSIYFENAEGQAQNIMEIMNNHKFKEIGTIKDYQEIDRIVFGRKI